MSTIVTVPVTTFNTTFSLEFIRALVDEIDNIQKTSDIDVRFLAKSSEDGSLWLADETRAYRLWVNTARLACTEDALFDNISTMPTGSFIALESLTSIVKMAEL